jgi:hypothetical protein
MPSRPIAPVVVLALASVIGVAALGLPVAAQGRSGRRAAEVALHAGDQVAVRGTHVRCAVSPTLPRAIACGLENGPNLVAKSYGVTIGDTAALFLGVSAAGRPGIVLGEHQPKIFGRAFPNASGKRRLVTVGAGTALVVAGTHIGCAVTNVPRALGVTCGITVPGSRGFVTGTYGGVVTSDYALLARKLSGSKAKTLIERKQP